MRLGHLEINGFKSFAQKTVLEFKSPIVCIVGPNGSGKSNVVEAFRFVLGEQSMKSMRGKMGMDLIFKGSKTLAKGSRALVTVYFDNHDHVFKLSNDEGEDLNLNYETLSISREVYPDGVNKYVLNGSEVRLKDINSLLSSVNIGASGHHIISQGEADRILNASPRDLREMIEDALGLKVYQYKIRDSERKLERAQENIKEVGMLRRENAPHLNFLKKQMEKIERVKEMREELRFLYQDYFREESAYIKNTTNAIKHERNVVEQELSVINDQLLKTEERGKDVDSKYREDLHLTERKINDTRNIRGEIERKLGRIEGMIEIKQDQRIDSVVSYHISPVEAERLLSEIGENVEKALLGEDISEIKNILKRIQGIIREVKTKEGDIPKNDVRAELEELASAKNKLLEEIKNLEDAERDLVSVAEGLRQQMNAEMEILRQGEKDKFNLRVRSQELSSMLQVLGLKQQNLEKEIFAFETEKKESVVLVGDLTFNDNDNLVLSWNEEKREEERRKIERIKIKLEDSGVGNAEEIAKEFNATKERDDFLSKEMDDLEKSIESLGVLIADLRNKIDEEFKTGVRKINKEFQEFFSLLFNGGNASLSVVEQKKRKRKTEDLDMEEGDVVEEEELEEGVEIGVSLPHKKVKELHALSGGERSLTSIALLFAMSQVNPPPFLILDETDAALDEANSKKFGDMVERLSKHSQLIVVTHNRETMSRAGMLYGVTVGSDGASKLLSVKFEEALAVAK